MADRVPYLGPAVKAGARTPYLGEQTVANTRTPYLGDTSAITQAKKGHGLLGEITKYSGADLIGHLGSDIGNAAAGFVPGLYEIGKAYGEDVTNEIRHPGEAAQYSPFTGKKSKFKKQVIDATADQYKNYYGHNVGSHIYQHPLQPILDALTVADLGASAGVRAGLIDSGRASLEVRSPRAIATGEGPVHTDISSAKPLVRAREVAVAKLRQAHPEGVGHGNVRVGGELKAYGKQIQQQATHNALGRLQDFAPYQKATRGLSAREWTALNVRALDIHPDDLAQLWKDTPAAAILKDAKTRQLITNPSKKLAAAETAARQLSRTGETLLKQRGLLKDETATARPDLTKRQASEVLGRPVKQLHGDPYYVPHTFEQDARNVNPLAMSGGGKAAPRKLGSMKQNTGGLFFTGKMHLRSDVLGPEFLRRVKYLKYDEIHNGLVRGAIRVTKKQIDENLGGHLPAGYEYIRAKPGQRIPATIRGQSTDHVPIDKLVPDANDLHGSELAKQGFGTTDPAQAHVVNGGYFIAPSRTIKAATGEFTHSGDFVNTFVSKPLKVWRAAVLGLRPGFFTNNFVGNSLMYAVKTGGNGALRDLLGAIKDEHGAKVAKEALDSAATPPALRKSLYQEFFPEQMQGTFGRTQSPATSAIGKAGGKVASAGRAVTGVIPKATSAVAEAPFRKALVRHYIRTSPEFKQVYRSLPKQTRTFEQAARQILAGDKGPEFQRFVSKQLNNALGDYLNLGPAERNVLRNALPFYAWYKAIATTTAHLAVDTPLRANILGQLGQIGKQWSDQQLGEVPSFLRDAIPLGQAANGTREVLSTQSLNPYATLTQLGQALGGNGDVSSVGLNPFVQGLLDSYATLKEQSKSGHVSPTALLAAAAKGVATDVPFAQVVHPLPPSQLYPYRNRQSTLYSYFGVPIKRYNIAAAAAQARNGR